MGGGGGNRKTGTTGGGESYASNGASEGLSLGTLSRGVIPALCMTLHSPHPLSEVPLVLRPGGGWRRGAIPAFARLGGKSPGPFERRIPRWRRSRGAASRPKGADAERPSWGAPNAKVAPGRRQLGAGGGSQVSGSRNATYVLG